MNEDAGEHEDAMQWERD